jgi:hypothetical protein
MFVLLFVSSICKSCILNWQVFVAKTLTLPNDCTCHGLPWLALTKKMIGSICVTSPKKAEPWQSSTTVNVILLAILGQTLPM